MGQDCNCGGTHKTKKGSFHIDVNATTGCTLRCVYCIEKTLFSNPKTPPKEVVEALCVKVDELLASEWFNEKFNCVSLNFWGGEPTMNFNLMKFLTDRYWSEPRVRFFTYSNGFKSFAPIMELIEKSSGTPCNGGAKFSVQISYDGLPAHNANRLDVGGKGSGFFVRQTIQTLIDKRLPFTLKATINPASFHLLPECYDDYLELFNEMVSKGYEKFRFFPTIDYLTPDSITAANEEASMKTFEKALLEIAKREISFFKKHGYFFFRWFQQNDRAMCAAGAAMSALDIDGKLYKCHGTLYSSQKSDHLITDVFSPTFVNDLKAATELHKDFKSPEIIPEECKSCPVEHCLRCNSTKYELSEKKDYLDRWYDFSNQPHLCNFYRLNHKIVLATRKVLAEVGK